MDNQKL